MKPPLIHDAARHWKDSKILSEGVDVPDVNEVLRKIFLDKKTRASRTEILFDKLRVCRWSLFDKVSIFIIDSRLTLSTTIAFSEMPVVGEYGEDTST